MRSTTRSKSPISAANLPRQPHNNNTFKIIGGGGGSKVNTDSAVGISRKMTSTALQTSNRQFSVGGNSSSSSSDAGGGGSLSRDRKFIDYGRLYQQQEVSSSYRRVETMGNQSSLVTDASYPGPVKKSHVNTLT